MYLRALLCCCTLVAASAQGSDFALIGKDASNLDEQPDKEVFGRAALRSPNICYTYTTTYLTTFDSTQHTQTR